MNYLITKIRFFSASVILLLLLIPQMNQAQIVNESTKKKISIGIGLFNDIWMNVPDDMKVRAINQGFNVFATYNLPFGKSNLSFAIGLGVRTHNLYWDYMYVGRPDSFQFARIPDSLDYKRSKLTTPYLELPIEFRLKTRIKMTFALGFKAGYMINGLAKYVGDDYLFDSGGAINYSVKQIKNIERFSYGPTLRIGYRWFNVNAYYSLSRIFTNGKGPDMYPISVGFVIMPF